MDGTLIIRQGRVYMLGVDMGGGGTILAETERHVVVKWPGSMGWCGRGERKYYSGEICVYEKGLPGKPIQEAKGVLCKQIIRWGTEWKGKK